MQFLFYFVASIVRPYLAYSEAMSTERSG